MNKRGLSPLIATVLLLFFAIGLGVIVMNWGRAQVEASSTCAIDTKLSIIKLNDIAEICYAGSGDQGYIHFIVENGPNINVQGLVVTVIGTKKVYNKEIAEEIKKGNSLLQDIPYNFDLLGDIRQVKISPNVMLYPGEDPILCPEQAIVYDKLRSC